MGKREVRIGLALTAIGVGAWLVAEVAPQLFPNYVGAIFWGGIAAIGGGILLVAVSLFRSPQQPARQEPDRREPERDVAISIRKAGHVRINDNYLPGQKIYRSNETDDFEGDRNRTG